MNLASKWKHLKKPWICISRHASFLAKKPKLPYVIPYNGNYMERNQRKLFYYSHLDNRLWKSKQVSWKANIIAFWLLKMNVSLHSALQKWNSSSPNLFVLSSFSAGIVWSSINFSICLILNFVRRPTFTIVIFLWDTQWRNVPGLIPNISAHSGILINRFSFVAIVHSKQ